MHLPSQSKKRRSSKVAAAVALPVLGILILLGFSRNAVQDAIQAVDAVALDWGPQGNPTSLSYSVDRGLFATTAEGQLQNRDTDEEVRVSVTQHFPYTPWITTRFERRRLSDGSLLGGPSNR